MDWLQQNWVLVVLGVVVLAVAIWWLVGSSTEKTSETPSLRQADEPVSPVIVGPAVSPIDVPPLAEPAPLAPEPQAPAEPIHAVPAGPADELTRLKGVGPKVAVLLNGLGVTRYDQIAGWTDADVTRVDAQLGAFKGRIVRDQWIEQARLLAAGDTAGYEAKFGKLG